MGRIDVWRPEKKRKWMKASQVFSLKKVDYKRHQLIYVKDRASNVKLQWCFCNDKSELLTFSTKKGWSTSVKLSGWSTSLSSQAFSLASIKKEQEQLIKKTGA